MIEETVKEIKKKKKLSLSQYAEIPNALSIEAHKDSNTEKPKSIKKVKCTFYIPEETLKSFNQLYAKLILKEEKIDKSDLIKIALDELIIKFKGVLNET